MLPLIPLIASMFAKEGLNLLSGVIKGGGDKAIELIVEKTGIDIKDIADPNTDTVLEPEQIIALKQFEAEEVVSLANVVAKADKGKATGIIMAAVAPEIPEILLFAMGVVMVLGFALAKQFDIASNLASAWIGAFAMYVKGK